MNLALPQETQSMLRLMAANSGHLERGGLAMREQSDYCNGGDVIGRTVWVGQPAWARGFGTVQRITATVEKAIAGKRRLCKQPAPSTRRDAGRDRRDTREPGGRVMGMRDEVAAIGRQCADMQRIRDELESEGAAHWAHCDLEREQWEADRASILEYENWFLSKTIMEADAEFIAAQ